MTNSTWLARELYLPRNWDRKAIKPLMRLIMRPEARADRHDPSTSFPRLEHTQADGKWVRQNEPRRVFIGPLPGRSDHHDFPYGRIRYLTTPCKTTYIINTEVMVAIESGTIAGPTRHADPTYRNGKISETEQTWEFCRWPDRRPRTASPPRRPLILATMASTQPQTKAEPTNEAANLISALGKAFKGNGSPLSGDQLAQWLHQNMAQLSVLVKEGKLTQGQILAVRKRVSIAAAPRV